jgi:CheY-like chemotaxis protein
MGIKLDQVGARILRLVNGLGLCSRGVSDHVHLPYSLGELLEHALAITAPRVRVRDVLVEVGGSPAANVMLRCNPGQVTQALVTLIIDGVQRAATLPQLPTGTRRVGIDVIAGEGEVELVFEVTATEAPVETLAVSERILASIAKRHGGDLQLEEEGGVRRRVLRLPALAALPSTQGASVLLVDDDPDILENLAQALAAEGVACERALSAQEALDKAAKGRYDVVISDINMPGIDGLELVQRLEARSARPPRFLLTTGYREHYQKRLADVTGAEVVDKPYDARAIAERVRDWLPH